MNNNEPAQHGADVSACLSHQTQEIEPATESATEIPELIQRDGLIHQRLVNSTANTLDTRRFIKLTNDLDLLRRISWPSISQLIAREKDATLVTGDPFPWGDCDAVLKYVILYQASLDHLLSRYEPTAKATFLQAPSFYRLLQDLLPPQFVDMVEHEAYANCANSTAAEDMDVFTRRLKTKRDKAKCSGQVGLPSGVPSLDQALSGLHGLTILTGPKGAGKTSLVMSSVWETLTTCNDVAVLFYSLDLPKDRIYERLFCRAAGVSYRQLTGVQMVTDQEKQQFKDAYEPTTTLMKRLRVVERDYGHRDVHRSGEWVKNNLTYELISNDCYGLLRATGARRLLIIVDMLSKWDVPDSQDSKTDPDAYRLDVLDRVRQSSRRVVGNDGYVIMATSELRKDTNGELNIDDVKGDGRIGSDADNVLLMWPKRTVGDLSDEPVPITLRIAKSRDGGRRGDLNLLFDHVNYRFSQADAEPDRGTRRRRAAPKSADPFGT